MKRIVITGGTGLIGQTLARHLRAEGYEVRILTRGMSRPDQGRYHWNPAKQELDLHAFESCYAVINLAGKKILTYWTKKAKQELRDSRIKSTAFLVEQLLANDLAPQHFIQASAIGYVGDQGSAFCDEDHPAGQTFMAQLCKDWEQASRPMAEKSMLSTLRIGMYLSPEGGFYATVRKLSKWLLATSFGWTPSYTNTTHYKELNHWVSLILSGQMQPYTYNAVRPEPITMSALMKAVAKQQGRAVILPPIPAGLLRLVIGQVSESLLHSTPVVSTRIPADLYLYADLEDGLRDLD